MRKSLLIATVILTLTTVTSGGAATSASSDGWWKGTVVLEQNLGMQNGKPRQDSYSSYRGSATLRIELTGRETANYDFSYTEDVFGIPTSPYCPGQLESSTTGSMKTAGAIKAFANGSVLRVVPKVDFRVKTTRTTCPGNSNAGETATRKIKLDYLEFAPGKGSGHWQGSGKLFCCYSNGEFPKPGETTVTWDITKVTPAAPKSGSSGQLKVGKLTLIRQARRPSAVYARMAIQQGGQPVTASSITCIQDFPTETGFGGPRRQKVPKVLMRAFTWPGYVQCVNGFNNARYEGKTMTGAIEFTVGKTKVTRKFSVRIGPGATLSAPKGAVIGKP